MGREPTSSAWEIDDTPNRPKADIRPASLNVALGSVAVAHQFTTWASANGCDFNRSEQLIVRPIEEPRAGLRL